jgi:hypothetical protein
MQPTAPPIADFTHVGHVVLLLFGGAVAAESLQMAFSASELAIADMKPFFDLTRLRAATCSEAHYVDYGEICMHFRQSHDPVCPSRDGGACPSGTHGATADWIHKGGDAVCIAVHRVRIDGLPTLPYIKVTCV